MLSEWQAIQLSSMGKLGGDNRAVLEAITVGFTSLKTSSTGDRFRVRIRTSSREWRLLSGFFSMSKSGKPHDAMHV